MAEIKTTQTINDVLKEFQQEIFKNINCVKVGKIVSFDAKKKTAMVSINFRNEEGKPNSLYQNYCDKQDPFLEELPVIGNCFHQPIVEGMSVLCLFNDNNIDKWYYNDTTRDPINDRKHDVSDGFVLCGLDNLINNSFERPKWWNPPEGLNEIVDCPIPKYGYDNEHAKLRYESGDVSVGGDGVTICSRDYNPVKIYSEGSAIYMHPTEEVVMDNGYGHFFFFGPESVQGVYDRIAGKFALYNDNHTKPNSQEGEPPFILSDMYRILKQIKKILSIHDGELGKPAFADINDLILRIDGLFVPGDGLEATADDDEDVEPEE